VKESDQSSRLLTIIDALSDLAIELADDDSKAAVEKSFVALYASVSANSNHAIVVKGWIDKAAVKSECAPGYGPQLWPLPSTGSVKRGLSRYFHEVGAKFGTCVLGIGCPSLTS
jgi:hypothetical protein